MDRRQFIGAGAAAIAAAAGLAAAAQPAARSDGQAVPRRGRIKQGLWQTVFGALTRLSLEEQCRIAARLGVLGFDKIAPPDWPLLRRHGLKPLMVESDYVDFDLGIVHPEFHDLAERRARPFIETCRAGQAQVMVFIGGLKRGMHAEQALDNAAAFLERLKSQLEDSGVVAGIENINNRYDQPGFSRIDQVFGPWAWGVELVRRVNSPNVKLICDLYHLQMQDGNLARTIREHIGDIVHFHVAGVPTRAEPDATQEVNWRYIAELIAATGYGGYVSHEWRPTPGRDPIASLQQALDIFDV